MTQPPESISVTCPKCQHEYKDWYRSLGFGSESFDEEYIENSAIVLYVRNVSTKCILMSITLD